MATREISDDMRDENTPSDVVIRSEARKPQLDPTCGVHVAPPPPNGRPRHRLVTLGDSITQGFQSAAIFHSDLSWPRIVAYELGWDKQFRYPTYPDVNGGMPFNLEKLLQRLDRAAQGNELQWWELPSSIFEITAMLVELDHYWGDAWQRGLGPNSHIPHNLAVWGWDLRDSLDWTADKLREYIERDPQAYWRNINVKSAYRVLAPARANGRALTVFEAAAHFGLQGTDLDTSGPGIETLVVELGANNALSSIVRLDLKWSGPGYDRLFDKDQYTVWRPTHFKAELDRVLAEVAKINARHVILATVPHVTIAPLARGVGEEKVRPDSRYYPFYCRPWVENFDSLDDKNITSVQARAIDSAIDQYNEAIEAAVVHQRKQGKDWYLLELAGLMDRLASRRYLERPESQPSWWNEVGGAYPLPAALQRLHPPPNSRFYAADRSGRRQGGLFSLDGVHPTTIGYGIIAQEVIKIMQTANVPFYWGDDQRTRRDGTVTVDFERLIVLDALISNPPPLASQIVSVLGLADQRVDDFLRAFGAHAPWP